MSISEITAKKIKIITLDKDLDTEIKRNREKCFRACLDLLLHVRELERANATRVIEAPFYRSFSTYNENLDRILNFHRVLKEQSNHNFCSMVMHGLDFLKKKQEK